MPYYIVPIKVEGNVREPDLPGEVSGWIGQLHGDTYLIKTNEVIEGITALTDQELKQECEKRGLRLSDVRNFWSVGDEVNG